MTTEILRNTLFQKQMIQNNTIEEKQIDLQFQMNFDRELGCVVFDEVHYINDADEKIWEETIIMLPKHANGSSFSSLINQTYLQNGWKNKPKEKIGYVPQTKWFINT